MTKKIPQEIFEIYHVRATGEIFRNGKKISPYLHKNRNGDFYERVCLFYKGKQLKFFVHTLVATYYHRPLKKNEQVDHPKHDTLSNGAFSIRIVSVSENQKNRRSWKRKKK